METIVVGTTAIMVVVTMEVGMIEEEAVEDSWFDGYRLGKGKLSAMKACFFISKKEWFSTFQIRHILLLNGFCLAENFSCIASELKN